MCVSCSHVQYMYVWCIPVKVQIKKGWIMALRLVGSLWLWHANWRWRDEQSECFNVCDMTSGKIKAHLHNYTVRHIITCCFSWNCDLVIQVLLLQWFKDLPFKGKINLNYWMHCAPIFHIFISLKHKQVIKFEGVLKQREILRTEQFIVILLISSQMFPLTCLQLRVDVVGLIWGSHAAPLIVLFTYGDRKQLAVFILSVADGTHREPVQLAVL